jgi:hypothetical protein
MYKVQRATTTHCHSTPMPSTRPARPAIGVVVVIVVEIVVVIVVEIVVVGEDLQNCGLLSKDRHRDN